MPSLMLNYGDNSCSCTFFFFNDTATTEIYTLSLHDALPICSRSAAAVVPPGEVTAARSCYFRSEEHTSELQSRSDLVCRLLLEKKKNNNRRHHTLNTKQKRQNYKPNN